MDWFSDNSSKAKAEKSSGYVMKAATHKTFVLMKTSWRRLEEDVHLRLQMMSSRDQDECIRIGHAFLKFGLVNTSWRCLEDVFKTFSRRLKDV